MRSQALFTLVLALAIVIADCNLEGDVLAAWRSSVVDPENILQSWDATLVNPCTWFHVTCNANNSVVRLDLGNAGLSGTISTRLALLSNLLYLELFGNNFEGVIPVQLGKLTNLISLDLYRNRLSGPIPAAFGNLRFLRFLRLNSNLLRGKIPDQVIQLISHGKLEILNVSENQLAGTVRSTKRTGFAITTVILDPKA